MIWCLRSTFENGLICKCGGRFLALKDSFPVAMSRVAVHKQTEWFQIADLENCCKVLNKSSGTVQNHNVASITLWSTSSSAS